MKVTIIAIILLFITLCLEVRAETITEITPLTYGVHQLHSSGRARIRIRARNGNVNLNQNADIIIDTNARGHYQVTCNNTGIASIDIQNVVVDTSEIILDRIEVSYNGGSPVDSFPAIVIYTGGAADLYIGARMRASQSVPVGVRNIAMDIIWNCWRG